MSTHLLLFFEGIFIFTHTLTVYTVLLFYLSSLQCIPCQVTFISIAPLIPPRLALFLRRLLPSMFCTLVDVLLVSNGLLGTHGRNIAPCGTICKVSMGATVFWVCRKWSSKEWRGWFVLRVYLIFEDVEEPAPDLELLL